MSGTTAGVVAVLGEALVDVILATDGSARAVPGGGPYNAARALARLGTDTLFLGRLSGDRFGQTLRSELRADGVRLAGLEPSADPTTLAVAELDADGAASYSFYLTATSAADLTAEVAGAALPPDTVALHVGTLGLVLEPVGAAVEALVAASPADRIVFCDPNCRPGTIADRAAYAARLRRVVARADVVKVSGDDLDYLYPGTPRRDAARAVLADGATVVLLTDGGAAVHVLHRSGEEEVPVPSVTVVDTVGAGDAFGAGFLHAWLASGRGRSGLDDLPALARAAAYGSRVAAITCTRAGASPPTAAEVG